MVATILIALLFVTTTSAETAFPGETWESRTPESFSMKSATLERLASAIGGRGCIVKDGYVIHAWGDQSERSDWMSSAKPVLSTLLFFAIDEGKLSGVDHRLADLGWPVSEKDQSLAFHHLANMTSGYARPEPPGAAWAYNDFAIQLYQLSLFDKVFQQDPEVVFHDPTRLGALNFEKGFAFREETRRISASVADFARVAWLWCNKGNWNGRQILPQRYFDEYMKPWVQNTLPQTAEAQTNDYLSLGSYGGDSDHFTEYGPGIYGFNWWFNDYGRRHPDTLTWPDAPRDTFMSIGAGGNNTVIIPSMKLMLVSAKGDWGKLEPGSTDSKFNRHIKTLIAAGTEVAKVEPELPISVPRWQPHDFVFKSETAHENSFYVPFAAEVSGPKGKSFTTHGFFNGDDSWVIRLAPDEVGEWSLITQSTDPLLDGKSTAFLCVANTSADSHGPVGIDKDHPRHFVHADGTRFFHLGYECDWLWALDLGTDTMDTTNRFLDLIKSNGFNVVLLNIYAHDTSWRLGKTADDDFGPPTTYPWAGTNAEPNHDRLNLRFWNHYDKVIAAMNERGIQAHIMVKVYNKKVKWPKRGSDREDLFLRTVVARYAAYPNVQWDLSKEAYNEKDPEYKLAFIQKLKSYDPYDRLVTSHDDDIYAEGRYDGILDYRSDQQHDRWHEIAIEQRAKREWPIVNVEYGYEWGMGGENEKTYAVAQSPEENARRAWLISLAGAYTAYYYTFTAWDVVRPADVPAGYAQQKLLRDFFEETEYWKLQPNDSLVSAGHCLANEGKEYIVYLHNSDAQKLTVAGAAGEMVTSWLNPFTGERRDASPIQNGVLDIVPPADWKGTPAVLWVREK